MSDQLSHTEVLPSTHVTDDAPGPARGRGLLRGGVQAVVVVAAFVAAGTGLGALWEHRWHPSQGTVVRHQWFVVDSDLRYDLDGLRNQADGPVSYLVIAFLGALVLGALVALLSRRRELVTLAAVTVGSLVAAVVMWKVGAHLGPPDPDVIARTAAKGTSLPDNLDIGSTGVLLAWPLGALLSTGIVFFLVPGRRRA